MHYLKYFVIPIALGIFIISCEKDDNTVIDPVLNIPSISDASFTPSNFDSDTINAVAKVRVSSVDPLHQVSVTLINPLNAGEQAFELKDDGIAPDSSAGDGIFTARVIYSQTCRFVGSWKAEFIAETVDGLLSSIIQIPFIVNRANNQPPVVSNIIIIPDSTQQNISTAIVFMVTAIDPNGDCDINRVFYTGFRPDNSALTPHRLYDDGSCCPVEGTPSSSGDTTANDSKYTRLLIGPPDQVGYYRYFIKAIDNSGDTSNVLADSIYVYP